MWVLCDPIWPSPCPTLVQLNFFMTTQSRSTKNNFIWARGLFSNVNSVLSLNLLERRSGELWPDKTCFTKLNMASVVFSLSRCVVLQLQCVCSP